MAISFQQAVGLYESALRIRTEKASLIASNLANADTPNYKAKDIQFHDALKAATDNGSSPLKLSGTQSGHIDVNGSSSFASQQFYRTPLQPSVDGNTVEEQVEHAEFMKNNLEFQAAFTLLDGNFKGMAKAVRGELR